ncbi:dipeptide epimerase [Planctomicrobium sp. SH527]|uniref:dipeptide epimerase n=1 Tax=Planctomicrobium sp. SH527 TaxID=3448123 RepID=UPI003F5B041F
MRLFWQRVALPLKDPFTIARGTIHHQFALIVSLTDGEATGFGETMCNVYYRHTYESLEASLAKVEQALADLPLLRPVELYELCQSLIPNDTFALSAIDCAGYDLYGKVTGQTTRELLEIHGTEYPCSSYTLGIDSIEEMIRKYHEQPNWPIYKIKLGTSHDMEIVQRLRQETDAVIRVDANCAWTPEQAINYSKTLSDLGVEFIEQPLPANSPREAFLAVYQRSALPIIADESCRTENDVEKCHGIFHGVNLKLVKCGGLTPAVRMLRQAREFGMRTMVGCMIESSVGISAAAQLLPLLDYADLDGASLLSLDPADGVKVHNGQVHFSTASGSGLSVSRQRLEQVQKVS